MFVDHLFVLVSSSSQEIDGDNPWQGYTRVRLVLCVDSLLNSKVFQRSFGSSINLISNGFFFNGDHPYFNELFCEAQGRLTRQKDINSGGYSKEEIQF